MLKGLVIRPMVESDLDEVVKIEEETFSLPFSRGLFSKFLAQDAFYSWTSMTGSQIIGYVIYSCAGGDVDLLNIAVDKKWRGKGVGAALMKKLFKEAKALGGERVFLEVRPSNAVALALYEKFGFFQIGVRRGYYHDTGEDALVYSREIE